MKKTTFLITAIITLATIINSCQKPPKIPTGQGNKIVLRIDSVNNIKYRFANVYTNIPNLRNKKITQHGHCWDTLENPDITKAKTRGGLLLEAGSFANTINNLLPNTKYYVRGYVEFDEVALYTLQNTFVTKPAENPIVETIPVTNITETTAHTGGSIIANGGEKITEQGICYSISPNPVISRTHIVDTSNSEVFIIKLTNLTSATTYYVRAYATNNIGTGYGIEETFNYGEIILNTTVATNITSTTATSGGNIADDGGVSIVNKGVCWSTSQNPTTADYKTEDGTDIGSFISYITGLELGTTYYVRAYATNSLGTSYADQETFTTDAILPTITTTNITNVSFNNATSGGNITNNGGATIITRGICWSTSQNPTISNSQITEGTGIGSFISQITDLLDGKTYYVRAYARNSVGINYGNEVDFTTPMWPCGSQISDYDGNIYETVNIGNQCWITRNLKVTHYPNGIVIPLVTDDTAWENLSDNGIDDAMCYYNNNTGSEADIYGALYTWAAAMGDNATSSSANPSGVQGICPTGWHLPSDDEWIELMNFLGYNSGCKLAGNSELWNNGDLKLNSDFGETGFSAVPSGSRISYSGSFEYLNREAHFWSATENSSENANFRFISYTGRALGAFNELKSDGVSIRCIKDR